MPVHAISVANCFQYFKSDIGFVQGLDEEHFKTNWFDVFKLIICLINMWFLHSNSSYNTFFVIDGLIIFSNSIYFYWFDFVVYLDLLVNTQVRHILAFLPVGLDICLFHLNFSYAIM